MTTKKTKVVTRKNLDTDKIANVEGGEVFSSQNPGDRVMSHKDTGLVTLQYESFTIINDEAMKVVRDHYTHPEVSRITHMTTMVNDCTNILKQDGDIPHSTETLMQTLGYNRNTFYVFIRKLMWHDIVSIWVKKVDRKVIKAIILNPYLARRSKTQIQLAKAFTDISNGLDVIVLEELPKIPTKVTSK